MNSMPPARPETIRDAMAVVEAKLQKSASHKRDEEIFQILDTMRQALNESIVYHKRTPGWLPGH